MFERPPEWSTVAIALVAFVPWLAPGPASPVYTDYDFIDKSDAVVSGTQTPSTLWSNQLGPVDYGLFQGDWQVVQTNDDAEGTAPTQPVVLETRLVDGGGTTAFLEGLYQDVALPRLNSRLHLHPGGGAQGPGQSLRFEAKVGIADSGATSSHISFELWLVESSTDRYRLSEVHAKDDGELTVMTADLSRFAGTTRDFALRVVAGPDGVSSADHGIWETATITKRVLPAGEDYRDEMADLHGRAGTLATWTSGYDPNPSQSYVTSGGPPSPDEGFAADASLVSGFAGLSGSGFVLQPNTMPAVDPDRTMSGRFTNLYVPLNAGLVRFECDLGVAVGSGADAICRASVVRYGATVARQEVQVEESTYAFDAQTFPTAAHGFSINLTGWQGEWIDLVLEVDADGDAGGDAVLWSDPRVSYEAPEVILLKEGLSATNVGRLSTGLSKARVAGRCVELHLEPGDYLRDTPIVVEPSASNPTPINVTLVGSSDPMGTRFEHRFPMREKAHTKPLFHFKDVENMTIRDVIFDTGTEDGMGNGLPFTQGSIETVEAVPNEEDQVKILWHGDAGYPDLERFLFETSTGVFEGHEKLQGHPRIGVSPFHIPFGGAHNQQVVHAVRDATTSNSWELTITPKEGLVPNGKWTATHKQNGNTIAVTRSTGHISIDDVDFHASGSVPVVTKGAQKTLFRDSSVAPPAGSNRIMSCAGTGIFVIGNQFGPEIVRSEFRYVMDEVCHSRPFAAYVHSSVNPTTTELQIGHRPFVPGDIVWPYHSQDGVATTSRIVDTASTPMSSGLQTITLDSPPDTDLEFDDAIFFDGELVPFGLFHDNDARFGRAGVHINGDDSTVSENHLELLNNLGIWHHTTAHTGFRGDRAVIRDNFIDRCGYRATLTEEERAYMAPIFVGSTLGAEATNSLPPTDTIEMRDVQILDNQIVHWARHAIVVYSTEDVTIDGNTLTNPDTGFWTVDPGWRSSIFLHSCAQVAIRDNDVVVDHRVSADVDGKVLVCEMDPDAEVSLSGTTFDTPGLSIAAPDIMHVNRFNRTPGIPTAPIASFTITSSESQMRALAVSDSLGLSNTSSDLWYWDMGDGTVFPWSGVSQRLHTYASTDPWEITMTVSNGNGQDTVKQTINW